MRDPDRIDRILGKIGVLWKIMPDLRFGQLLINLSVIDDTLGDWNAEDDRCEALLDYWIESKTKK